MNKYLDEDAVLRLYRQTREKLVRFFASKDLFRQPGELHSEHIQRITETVKGYMDEHKEESWKLLMNGVVTESGGNK